jgi:hypothetical protein
MGGEDHVSAVERVSLADPRPLTSEERDLLDFLVESPTSSEELRKQVATARVVGVCSCGCPSVWLEVEDDDQRGSRTESFPITARQGRTEVTLHIVQGRLHELEIWAGGYGVRPRVDVTKLEYASG